MSHTIVEAQIRGFKHKGGMCPDPNRDEPRHLILRAVTDGSPYNRQVYLTLPAGTVDGVFDLQELEKAVKAVGV